MDYSRKISEWLWNSPDKGELESRREQTFIDDIVQKSHIEKELLLGLNGVKTAFDGGAGSGRFSLLLAKMGVRVTHFDISRPMIDKAKALADEAGVAGNMIFVEGALEDLSAYGERAFDLVMSFDAPVSYTYPNHADVIKNLVRIAGKKIMLSVSSRLGALPYFANPIQKNQFILDENCGDSWVKWCVDNKENAVKSFAFSKADALQMYDTGISGAERAIEEYKSGGTPWPITYHFMPGELHDLLSGCGVQNISLAGPGAYARTVPNEVLKKIMHDPAQREDFLCFCHMYDSDPSVCGLGKDNLFAKGDIL